MLCCVCVCVCTCMCRTLAGLVLQAGPHVRILSVGRLGLETETHANTPWPWERMMIGRCDVSMVAFLPNPQPGTATPIIHITEVDITPSVTEVSGTRLTCTMTTRIA